MGSSSRIPRLLSRTARPDRRRKPALEFLEGRALLSSIATAESQPGAVPVAAARVSLADDPVPDPEPAPCPLPGESPPTGNPELPPSGPVGPGL